MEGPLVNFRDWDLHRFQPLINGMDLLTKVFTVKQLPRLCFENLGGKELAMKKLRHMRQAKPSHIERRKQQKLQADLQAMKARMGALEKKRKREDTDADEDEDEEMPQDANHSVAQQGDLAATESASSISLALPSAETHNTKEESELVVEETGVDKDGYESDDENVVGYSKDEVKQVIGHTKNKSELNKFKGKRMLPVPDDVSKALKRLGYNLCEESEMNVIGSIKETKEPIRATAGKITFLDKFDIVELDQDGRVIDKGDDDFSPSKSWIGRKPGFEFKLGERGLGYYRTGKEVVVPSNTTY